MKVPKPVRSVLALVIGAGLLFSIIAAQVATLYPLYFLIRPFSEKQYLRISSAVQASYLIVFPFVLEKILGIEIRLTGVAPPNEASLVLCNHWSHEWVAMYCLGYRTGNLGLVRTVIKDVIKYVPGFGWGMYLLYWPFVTRDFAKDETILKEFGEAYHRAKLPVQLWLYPEGTRQTPKKLAESQKYAKEQGYPVWNHIMLPRHRGFNTTAKALTGLVKTILNVTVQYEGWKRAPSVWQIFTTDLTSKHVVHVNVSRVAMAALPADDDGKKQWLMDSFAAREALLTEFESIKRFPGPKLNKDLSFFAMLPHLVLWSFVTFAFWSSVFGAIL